MKKLIHYYELHKTEVIYLIGVIVCVIVSFVFQSWIPALSILIIYFASVTIDFICFLLLKAPLFVETPDGYNEPYHPSVLFFKNGWCGYRYWMAFTPMPKKAACNPYTDRWECPCVYASNDGIHFETPVGGVKRFIDDLSETEINHRDYFSDTHLVYNKDSDRLELYYRLTNRCTGAPNGEILRLLRKTSKDGLTWSERENLVSSNQNTDIGQVYVSPAIIMDNNEYLMWFVSSYGDKRSMSFAKSHDMQTFYDVEKCRLIGRDCDPWHIDCHKADNKYYLLVYEFSDELSLWESADGVSFSFQKMIHNRSKIPGCFYSALYRSCITENHLDGYSIYFSAQNRKEMCLGIMTGDRIDNYYVIDGNGSKNLSLFFLDVTGKYFYAADKLLKKVRR